MSYQFTGNKKCHNVLHIWKYFCLLPSFVLLSVCVCICCMHKHKKETFFLSPSIGWVKYIYTHTMSHENVYPHIISHDKHFEVCFKNNRTVGSLGVWIGDNPLDFVLPVTLCQLILYFMFSRVLYCLLRPLQTPRFICSVLVSFYYLLI